MLYVIVLNILKIAGIIIISLLAFILLLLIALLFVPIRYKAFADKPSTDKKYKVKVTISWLLQLFAFCLRYKNDDKIKVYLRILCFRKSFNNNKKDKTNKNKKKATKKESKSITSTDVIQTTDNQFEDEDENDDNIEDIIKEDVSYESKKDGSNDKTTEKNISKIKLFADKFIEIINKIKSILVNIKSKLLKIPDTLESVKNKAAKLYSFADDEKNKKGIKAVLSSFMGILKKVKPKIKSEIHFGFDDPYKMGQILSVLGILYPIYADGTDIYPEFDNGDFYYGRVLIKGKIRIFTLLLICFKLYRDRNFKYLYKSYKEIKK